jgi:hypothetical protein
MRLLITALALCLASGCARGLDHEEAKRVIEQNPLIKPAADNVKVDAISSTSATEAVVRATIAENNLNLKFRRFDKGWTWEFVETKAGGWIAPDVAMGQIREEQRAVAAAAWAAKHKEAYAATARKVWLVSVYHVDNPTVMANPALKKQLDKGLVAIFSERRGDPDAKERLQVLTSDRVLDAWGSEIGGKFDPKSNGEWLLVSPGADKQLGTADDLLCLNTFTRGYEDGRMVWNHSRAWTVPEGLAEAVEPHLDKRSDTMAITKMPGPF